MGDVHYMISETSKRVGVESHVLRYWEEELDLPIGRTEMGHRHYTEDDIQLFCCIKELKDQGMQLKEIKGILPDMLRAKEILKAKRTALTPEHSPQSPGTSELPASSNSEVLTQDSDLDKLQKLFGAVVQNVIFENNKILEENICKGVTEKVAKDMDFLLQAKERQEEDRFRKLDHLIRQQQNLRREAAKPAPARYLRKLFGETSF